MVIVNIIGGLGNQMFQYAFGKYLSIENNCELKLDISGFEKYEWHRFSLSSLSISENFSNKEECDFLKGANISLKEKLKRWLSASTSIATEKDLNFNINYRSLKSPIYITGYWQSEKYFQGIENIIKKEFIVSRDPSIENQKMSNKIINENSISLHIRRGNYVNVDYVNQMHGTSTLSYYHEAISLINSKIKNPVYFIFSDDISWAKQNLFISNETVYVDINDENCDFEDLRLMYTCKHNIIANSTFSWWGAWLNPNKEKMVIAPKIWFNNSVINMQTENLIPSEWLRI